MSQRNCPSCGAPIALNATECRYCGEEFAVPQAQSASSQPAQAVAPIQPKPIYREVFADEPTTKQYIIPKNKLVAGLLGIFLGGLGIHKFYLGRVGWGIVYLIFCWTYIPIFLGVIEGIAYLASNEEKFQQKYGKKLLSI